MVGRRCAAVRSVAVLWLPLCTAKLTLPWLAQRNCTLDAVDCSTNCAQSADSSRRSLQCNQCRCRMCDFCLAELGDPKRPRRPQTYHATLARRTTSWHEGKQQSRGKRQHLHRSNATAPEASTPRRGAAWSAGNEMYYQIGVRSGWIIGGASSLVLVMIVVLCVTAWSNQLTRGPLARMPDRARARHRVPHTCTPA